MIRFLTLLTLKIFDSFHQKKLINFFIKKGKTKFQIVFDVGAHHGETILLFSKYFEINNIFSFEPSEINFSKLKKNLEYKNLKRIKLFLENLGLGKEKKKIRMKQLNESSSSTINDINTNSKYFKKKSLFLYENKEKFYDEIEIKQTTLSDYIFEKKINKIDLLKIDTEGYEMNVLCGLKNNFNKVSFIMFEHHYHDMILKKYNFHEIHTMLKKNNFKRVFKAKMPFRKTFEYIYENQN